MTTTTNYLLPSVEIPIVSVTFGDTRDVGKEAAAMMPSYHRYRYLQDITYTLSDGRTIASNIHAISRPKLLARATAVTNGVSSGEYFVSFRGEQYVGIVQKFSLCPR